MQCMWCGFAGVPPLGRNGVRLQQRHFLYPLQPRAKALLLSDGRDVAYLQTCCYVAMYTTS